jgi:hypothetical protein
LRDEAPGGFGGSLAVLMVGILGTGEGVGLGGEVIAVLASSAQRAMTDRIEAPNHLFDGQFRKKFW